MGKGSGRRGTDSDRTRLLERQLKGAEAILEWYEERNEQLESRIAQLENQLQAERRKTARALARQAPTPRGQLDLNTASLHELRAVGLTITESARVIAHREILDGLDSLEVVNEIPELSADARELLRECGGIRSHSR